MSAPSAARRVHIAAPALARIRQQARQAVPGECCGALLGRADPDVVTIAGVLPLPNRAAGSRRYLVDAPGVRQAETAAREAGLDVVGFYHSHPARAPEPSNVDVEAAWPWYCYLIVDARTGDVRAWRLAEDRSRFLEEPLSVAEEGS